MVVHIIHMQMLMLRTLQYLKYSATRTEMEVAGLNSTTAGRGGVYGFTLGLVPMGSLIMTRLTPFNVALSPGHAQIFYLAAVEKIGRRPGIIDKSQTKNGRLG